MSFYKDYMKERENFETLEHPFGFASYQISPIPLFLDGHEFKMIYLKDIYISPNMRRQKMATEIADRVSEIGIAEGCQKLVGSVCLTDPHVNENLKTVLSYGLKFLRLSGNLLFFMKEL